MKIRREVLEQLLQGRKGKNQRVQEERGGLLLGRSGTILKVIPAPNRALDPTVAFEPTASWLVAAFQLARQEGFEVMASFHSHPEGGNEPSEVDRKTLAGGLPMMIVDEIHHTVRLWHGGDWGLRELRLEIEDRHPLDLPLD